MEKASVEICGFDKKFIEAGKTEHFAITVEKEDLTSYDHMNATMQALLLCAMYELAYTTDVDAKIIIQEYVDLAYAFFMKNEPKMINALLDQIAKDVRI